MIFHYNLTKKKQGILAVAVVLILVGIFFISRKIFQINAKEQLDASSTEKILEFKSSMNKEIVYAIKMAYSPKIVKYLANPQNEEFVKTGVEEFKKWEEKFLSHIVFWISDKDLKCYFNGEYLYTLDKGEEGSYWYDRTYNADTYFFNLNFDKGLKKTFLWVDVPVYDSKEEKAGITGTGIPVEDFIGNIYKKLQKTDLQLLKYMLQLL